MPSVSDVNLLLTLIYPPLAGHSSALKWFDSQGVGDVVWCRLTQLSVLRLLSTRELMAEDVCTQQRAWEAWHALALDERLRYTPEPTDLETYLRAYTDTSLVAPKRWQDAYLAAFARAAGLELVTFDAGMTVYSDLSVTVLKP